jgi:hypothetical protein
MPIRGAALYNAFAPLLRAGQTLEPDAWFDAHTHMGANDPDGTKGTPQEIVEGLDFAQQSRALIFAMQEPDGYAPANDAVAAAVAGAGGRLTWLARVDPNAPGAVDELRRCLAAGASGLKLHPRSDSFALPHPVVDELVAVCAQTRRPVLFHAGRGIPNLGFAAADLARRHRTPIILAHAGISDLGLLEADAAELPDLYFDTAWWNVADMLQLLATIPPARILYASDMPYGPGAFTQFLVRRSAAELGLGDDVLRSIAGAQLTRILAGEDPLDLGPPPGAAALGQRVVQAERTCMFAGASVQLAFRGTDCNETIALARLGCQHGPGAEHAELLDACDALLARALEQREQAGGELLATIPGVLLAHVIAGTPNAGAPSAAV